MRTLRFMGFMPYAGILLLAGLLACGRGGDSQVPQGSPPSQDTEAQAGETGHAEEAHDHETESRHIRVEPVRSATLPISVRTTGEVVPHAQRVAQVTSRVSGWVEEIYAFQEDRVRKGQVLVRIYSPDYLTAQTEFFLAEDRLRRAGNDPEEKRVALAVLEASKTRLRLLGVPEKRIQALHREHDEQHRVSPYLEVLSPLDGTVIESTLRRGKAVSPGDLLMRVADLSRLWVLVDIYEKDLARIRQGAPVRIRTPAFPGRVFQGRLVLLSSIQQQDTRTVKARAVVENPRGMLRPGMFVEAEVLTHARRRVLAVPERAVVLLEGQPTVFVSEEPDTGTGKEDYAPRTVEVGQRFNGRVEILRGLKEGERIVVEGAFGLKAALLKEKLGEGHGH